MIAHYAPLVVRKRPARIPSMVRVATRLAARRQWLRGEALARFEEDLSGRLDGAEVAAVGSGRFALLMVLEALGVRPPDRIALASYNASCVPNVLQAAGYRLHFVDIDPQRLTVTVDGLSDVPDDAPVLIATHIEGCPAPAHALREWADRRGSWLVEDAAHALGAEEGGQPVGTIGHGAIFSLGRGKHLNTLGGGLAVVARDLVMERRRLRRLAQELEPQRWTRLMRELAMEQVVRAGTHPSVFSMLAAPMMRVARRFDRDPMTALFEDDKARWSDLPPSLRARLSNLQAAFGSASLARFDSTLARRRGHAARMVGELRDVSGLKLQEPPRGGNDTRPAWLELTALVEDRDRFQRALLARGVDTQRTWMDACHLLPAFRDCGGGNACPVSRKTAETAVYLPTYASLSDSEVDRVIAAVRDVLS